MKLPILPLIALSCFSFVHSASQAAPQIGNNEASDTIMVVERTGKPPFKRTFAPVSTADVAQFEITSQCEETKTVVMRGKPPFKRTTECLNVVDVAQFETTSTGQQTDFSGRPPFKRH
ncbi:hypothetical protein [Alteromonas lipolytica]|uniref:Uncharacterized protein n=1 Tax=Alteromonas lipolytica TaxID=1856405 RepID=A0A1E8FGT0_9ALTE|nr:hypothetical protein [Alteromonas lipolytica]OFI34946.1 hypothetical protein BFC17_15385 [Alteromonas lipolytica]GGF55308.1 hypothetical protein GCM10011338_04450 [Alteromonas lipolytica]